MYCSSHYLYIFFFFFLNDTAPPTFSPFPPPPPLPSFNEPQPVGRVIDLALEAPPAVARAHLAVALGHRRRDPERLADRKSTRLNSSHANISYAVFCLKKKKKTMIRLKRDIKRSQNRTK